MILSGAVNIVPDIDIVAKIDVENEAIAIAVNGEVVYDSTEGEE